MKITIKPEDEILDAGNIAKYISDNYKGNYEEGIKNYQDDKLTYTDDRLQIVIESLFNRGVEQVIDNLASERLEVFIENNEAVIKAKIKELEGASK